jgi:hypothetical protein
MDVHRGGWEEVSKNWLTMLNKNPHNIFYTPMDDSYQQFANKYWNIKWNLDTASSNSIENNKRHNLKRIKTCWVGLMIVKLKQIKSYNDL